MIVCLHMAIPQWSIAHFNDRVHACTICLKLLRSYKSCPLRRYLEILAKLHEQFDQYSIHELCEAPYVSQGTFYNHIFRRADLTAYFQVWQALMLHVKQILEDSKQQYEPKRIRAVLPEKGELPKEASVQKAKAVSEKLYRLLYERDMGNRYYVFQSQGPVCISLRHHNLVLPPGSEISGITFP